MTVQTVLSKRTWRDGLGDCNAVVYAMHEQMFANFNELTQHCREEWATIPIWTGCRRKILLSKKNTAAQSSFTKLHLNKTSGTTSFGWTTPAKMSGHNAQHLVKTEHSTSSHTPHPSCQARRWRADDLGKRLTRATELWGVLTFSTHFFCILSKFQLGK